jgi:hypothetical protein
MTLIYTNNNGETITQTFRYNALKQAHAAYDKAVNAGYTIVSFTTKTGSDMQDRRVA